MDKANNDTRGRAKCLATLRKRRQRSGETKINVITIN